MRKGQQLRLSVFTIRGGWLLVKSSQCVWFTGCILRSLIAVRLPGISHPIMKLPLPQLEGTVKRFFAPPNEAVAIAKALEPKEREAGKKCKEIRYRPDKMF